MSLRERLGREIKQKALAGAATLAVITAGCASPADTVEKELPVQIELPVKIEFPPCDVNPQSKTVEITNGVTVVIGDLEITKGNNPEELEIQPKSQEMSPLSIDQVKYGETAIDLKTGRIFQIKGGSVETSCDPIETASSQNPK